MFISNLGFPCLTETKIASMLSPPEGFRGESMLAILVSIRHGKPKFKINIYWVTICYILTTFRHFFNLCKKYDFILSLETPIQPKDPVGATKKNYLAKL